MRVINDGNFCLICGATTDGFDCELGIYSSEEKALRVLDEIQDYIEDVRNCTIDDMGRGFFVLNKRAQIYEMPADEEDFKWDQ